MIFIELEVPPFSFIYFLRVSKGPASFWMDPDAAASDVSEIHFFWVLGLRDDPW